MRRLAPALITLAAVAVPAAQGQQGTDRVTFAAFKAEITTVPQYVSTGFDGDSGSWRGPNCVPRARLDLAKPLSLTWSIGTYRVTSPEAAAQRARTFDWKVVETTQVRLPHVIATRPVGTVPATVIVTDAGEETGYHEAALGFTFAPGRFAGAEAWSRGNAFACLVEPGGTPVAQWHRRVAKEALTGIRIYGNLPPARVNARRSGRAVRGTVADVHGHPLVAAAARLEQKRGSRWRAVRSGRTSASGSFALRLKGSGSFRVAITASGTTARSRSFRG